jgi:hypothetical protein
MAYIKNHDPWTVLDLLTARALNHLETQWDEVKSDADIHNHDTRYYTQTLADATFFSLTFRTGFDADMIDGKHYSELISDAMPIGAIVYWPSESAVPTGWHKCDGSGGTANLRDMFIIGAGNVYDPAETGGSSTLAIAGTIAVGNHSVTNDEMPLHTHTYTDHSNSQNASHQIGLASSPVGAETHISRVTGTAGSGNVHGHTGSTITLSDITVMPPYYALYLIQKVS